MNSNNPSCKSNRSREATETAESAALHTPEPTFLVAPPQATLTALAAEGYNIATLDNGGFSFSYAKGYTINIFPVPNSSPQQWYLNSDSEPYDDDPRRQENMLVEEIQKRCNPNYVIPFDGNNTIEFIQCNILEKSTIDHEQCATFITELGIPAGIHIPDEGFADVKDRFLTAVEYITEKCAQTAEAWSQIPLPMRAAILYTAAVDVGKENSISRGNTHELTRVEQQLASLVQLTKEDNSKLIRTRAAWDQNGGLDGVINKLATDPFWKDIRTIPPTNNLIVDCLFPLEREQYIGEQRETARLRRQRKLG
jgi:hypothetical protein